MSHDRSPAPTGSESATRLLIAAVDLGLSPFVARPGHEVSPRQAWVSTRKSWEVEGGMADMDSEGKLEKEPHCCA